MGRRLITRSAMAGTAVLVAVTAAAMMPRLLTFGDPSGKAATFDTSGAVDTSGPFFQSLGTNGRTCATCHTMKTAVTLSAASARATFEATNGSDPLFADVDGANCPGVAAADRDAHSLVLDHGLFRIAMPMPASAQFTIETVYDPYGCADTIDASTGTRTLSVYRRPLPATNLRFLSTVMFDGRETVAPLSNGATFAANLLTDLRHQALDATLGHAQASVAPTDAQLDAIAQFELALYTAQSLDAEVGSLRAHGASGGPVPLSSLPYYPGINDPLGGNPTGAAFDSRAFTLFSPWGTVKDAGDRDGTAPRADIAAGEDIFNTFPIAITNVSGLNDALGQPTIAGHCTTCHDTPNVGDHSLPVPLDIGVSHPVAFETDPQIASAVQQLSAADLPVFKVTCTAGTPGRTVYTSDPGRALVTGKCSDLTRGKGPILRGLAARAPYFHNGAAASLREVVEFYDQRFQMGLTDAQKRQLIAFLQAL